MLKDYKPLSPFHQQYWRRTKNINDRWRGGPREIGNKSTYLSKFGKKRKQEVKNGKGGDRWLWCLHG